MSDTSRTAGVQALKSGDPKGAIQHLAQAVQQNPRDAHSYAYLGAAFGQLNMSDNAVECLTRAVALEPASAPLQFNLGTALERAGRGADAAAAYRKALAVDGAYERASQALARLGQPGAPYAPSPPSAPAANGGLSDFMMPGSAPQAKAAGSLVHTAPPAAYPPPPAAYPPPPQAASPTANGHPA
ncbi:MAG TPA: tetratricopeptide repeat protein, partial [Armatimonadota bacterium]|nr:tetratricopeptide repeat protein [Armatimonadota bacterium]